MTLLLQFEQAASADLIDASRWYEGKRKGLGMQFVAEVERCLSIAAEHPLRYPFVHKDIRRIVLNRFPYSIYFRADTRRIVVLAIFHARRDPQRRLP